MTVGELIAELKGYDQDTIVVVGSDYGDRAGTIQAVSITGSCVCFVQESAYSDSGYKICRGYDDEDGEHEEVIILNEDIL